MKKGAFLLCLLGAFWLPVASQTSSNDQLHQLRWNEPQSRVIQGRENVSCPSFDGAIYSPEESPLPIYSVTLPIAGNPAGVNAKLVNPVFEAVPAKEVGALKKTKGIESAVIVDAKITYYLKKPLAALRIMPIRKNALTGSYERLVSFRLEAQGIGTVSSKRSKRVYAQRSVLASGDWYKIGVLEEGVYKLTYSNLKNKGYAVEGISSGQIRLFGNGGGMLPFSNSTYRHDDLKENAIQVVDGGDGDFGPGDYVLFYGQSPHGWDVSADIFAHQTNVFSDTTFYFLTFDNIGGLPKRINTVSSEPSATETVNSFSGRDYYEVDLYNLIKSGRQWYGDQYSVQTTYSYKFNFPGIISSEPATLRYSTAARSLTGSSSFRGKIGGTTVFEGTISPTAASYESIYARTASGTEIIPVSDALVDLQVEYVKPSGNPNAIGWLNFVEFNVRQRLAVFDEQTFFRDLRSYDISGATIAGFEVDGASSTDRVWDITDPVTVKQQQTTFNNGTLSFNRKTDQLLEFVAIKGNEFPTPILGNKIPNQNLHGLPQADMVIVTHPRFLSHSQQIADLHRQSDDLSVEVVLINQVYNEFSSGAQDITAIKDLMRMFYDRAGSDPSNFPKYLLLFGDASYDYKDRVKGNTNFVPTYQSAASLSPISSFATDDYFGLLDENEGESDLDVVDLGIGRLMVRNEREAQGVVEKIKHYYTRQTFGPWRNNLSFVADDEDTWITAPLIHMEQSDSLAKRLDTTYDCLNIDKIMFDAFPQVSGAGGARYPEVNDAIQRRMDRGALVLSYTGHGGEAGWAHERVLGVSEINNWSNKDNMPLLLTATCEFSRYDDPLRTSGGELALLNPDGGAIALMTTTRLVTAWENFDLATAFFEHVYEDVDGEMPRLGDVYRLTKRSAPLRTNSRKFSLLGDPAVRLAYPKHQVITTSFPDSVRALDKVTVKGYIANVAGKKLTDFNGTLYPLVFDQPASIVTLDNENWGRSFRFESQSNVLFRGKASVRNGEFEFEFVVPKDLAPSEGVGRVSYYADNGVVDACGAFEGFTIGGQSTSTSSDDNGPQVELYMNDETFVYGSLTDENPDMLAYLFDASGINTSSAGIGHDLVAILDENTADAIVLNDYYESELDSYRRGSIRYPFSELDEGKHTLRIKVWDVNNNSTDAKTEFVVASGAELALEHVLNYPNPFTTHTDFYFSHNQPGQELSVRVQVFTISGRVVKTIDGQYTSEGFRIGPIAWDGRDEYGDRIGRGVYVYKVKVTAPTGKSVDEFQKLVILN